MTATLRVLGWVSAKLAGGAKKAKTNVMMVVGLIGLPFRPLKGFLKRSRYSVSWVAQSGVRPTDKNPLWRIIYRGSDPASGKGLVEVGDQVFGVFQTYG